MKNLIKKTCLNGDRDPPPLVNKQTKGSLLQITVKNLCVIYFWKQLTPYSNLFIYKKATQIFLL